MNAWFRLSIFWGKELVENSFMSHVDEGGKWITKHNRANAI